MSSRPLIVFLLLAPLVIGGCDRQSPPAEQPNAAAPVATADEMPSSTPASAPGNATEATVVDTIGTLDRSHKGSAALDLAFTDPSGKKVTLAAFRGKPVLLNLWATWCAPCVAEMPTLDTLAGRLDGKVAVLTVSQDLEGAAKVTPFFAKGGYRHLEPYLDKDAGLSIAYQANLPTTILIDSQGKEVWRMAGGMDWTSVTAGELVDEAR